MKIIRARRSHSGQALNLNQELYDDLHEANIATQSFILSDQDATLLALKHPEFTTKLIVEQYPKPDTT